MGSYGAQVSGRSVSRLLVLPFSMRRSSSTLTLFFPLPTVIFAPLLPYLPTMVYLLGLSGLLGTTMFFSFASDLLALLTFHIFVFYLMATSIFRWHLSMLGALFNIFRGECYALRGRGARAEGTDADLHPFSFPVATGKKFNVLRNRVEPAVYEVDQLLLGTILFTLAAFLFPTVLVYYLAFAAVSSFFPSPFLSLSLVERALTRKR